MANGNGASFDHATIPSVWVNSPNWSRLPWPKQGNAFPEKLEVSDTARQRLVPIIRRLPRGKLAISPTPQTSGQLLGPPAANAFGHDLRTRIFLHRWDSDHPGNLAEIRDLSGASPCVMSFRQAVTWAKCMVCHRKAGIYQTRWTCPLSRIFGWVFSRSGAPDADEHKQDRFVRRG